MPSKGLAWALSMFGLDMVELLVLIEVVFFDLRRSPLPSASSLTFIQLYFLLAVLSCALQLVGVVFVATGWFRLGGALQIVASAFHVPKGEGIIGVIGGLQAYRYPALASQEPASS